MIDFDKLSGAPNGTKLELFVGRFEETGCVVLGMRSYFSSQ